MFRRQSVVAAVILTAGVLSPAAANDGAQAAARCLSVEGALLRREAGKDWQPVRAGDEVWAGNLLVALPHAELRSADGALKLVLLADAGHRGPFPVLETGVRLNPTKGPSADVTLERGILGLVNLKKAGAVTARVRVAGAAWDLTLAEPGTVVGLEVYSLHPPGLPALEGGKVGPPTTEVVLLVKQGEVVLKAGAKALRLHAPPGPARALWDSVSGEFEVQRLDKLPPSLLTRTAEEEKLYRAICAAAARLNDGPVGPTVDKLIHSDQKVDRRVGVTVAGALDDLPRLLAALADAKHADVRDQAVLVLRHWVGRGPGQVEKLYAYLTGPGGYPAARARSGIQLLFGFSDEDRRRPDTYAVLLDLLEHKSLAVRELARWHLVRLVPAGKDIPYDAAAPAAERQRAVAQWRALIPPGQLPGATPAAPPARK